MELTKTSGLVSQSVRQSVPGVDTTEWEGGTDGLTDQPTRLREFHMLYGTKNILTDLITTSSSVQDSTRDWKTASEMSSSSWTTVPMESRSMSELPSSWLRPVKPMAEAREDPKDFKDPKIPDCFSWSFILVVVVVMLLVTLWLRLSSYTVAS